MSRESFDSYRRSFDISARAPIPLYETNSIPRLSSDAPSFFSIKERRKADWPEDHAGADDDPESFEDVKLNEEAQQKPVATPAKRRGLFARFGTEVDDGAREQHPQSPGGIGHGFWTSRKRAQSQTAIEAELTSLPATQVSE
jgi:hypothetical protein